VGYNDLDDEQKIEESIKFVATGTDLPDELKDFLVENNLYDLIVQPVESVTWANQSLRY
jgi:hypothetical protein